MQNDINVGNAFIRSLYIIDT